MSDPDLQDPAPLGTLVGGPLRWWSNGQSSSQKYNVVPFQPHEIGAPRHAPTNVGLCDASVFPLPAVPLVTFLVLVLNKQDKYLQWDALLLQDVTAPAQYPLGGQDVRLLD